MNSTVENNVALHRNVEERIEQKLEELMDLYEEYLRERPDDELLDDDDISTIRQEEIANRLGNYEEELEEMDNDELLGEEFMENLREKTRDKIMDERRTALENDLW